MVRNNNKPPSRRDWYVENVVYVGDGKFYANGVGNGISDLPTVIHETTGANGGALPNAPATVDPLRNHVQVGLDSSK